MITHIEDVLVVMSNTIGEALSILDKSGKGIVLLIDCKGVLIRVITDGDLRRLILSGCSLEDTLDKLEEQQPIVMNMNDNKLDILAQMNTYGINHIVLVDDECKPVKIVCRQDIDTRILLSAPHMGEEEKNFVSQAFGTNWIAPVGPNIDAFEQELSEKLGVSYAVAVSSGTAAIHLALRVLGVSEGDNIFCSTFTFVATVNPIIYQGAVPVFIDSDEDSWNMSPQALEKAFIYAASKNNLPKAVIVVNLYGQSADMDAIISLCDQYDVPVIEDAAESLGATYKNKASGTLGKIGIYSFNGNKIITTSGGGMLVTNDKDLAQMAKFLSTQAREPVVWYEHKEVGYNYRMSNVLAGIGRGQLKVLDDRIEARRAIFEQYVDLLKEYKQIQWMPEAEFGRSTRWLSALRFLDTRIDILQLCQEMAEENIEVRPLWKPMHRQPAFEKYCYFTHEEGVSVSDSLFATGLCLPSGSNLTGAQVKRVVSALKSILERV